jgi:putative hydrolase of the HAD superfamily
MNIRALLLDADGVVQRSARVWRDELARLIGTRQHLDAFAADVVAAEKPCLIGAADFSVELKAVLEKWHSTTTVEEALRIWTDITVDRGILTTVSVMRARGLFCCLATNQHAQRAAYMSAELRYREFFDREFYSCAVGRAKPDPDYFQRVVVMLGLPPQDVLFFDDNEPNAAAAREVGINGVHFEPNAGSALLIRRLEEFGVNVNKGTPV